MIAADHHAFVSSRKGYAECACGWKGKPTSDKKKSHKGHVRRVSS